MADMNWWLAHNFQEKLPALHMRMQVIKAVRGFFEEREYWEVETPILQTMPCADMHIHGFATQYFGADLKPQRDFYLQTSPEFAMKKLLVAGAGRIFQICKVFRNGESTRRHSPEFTMLEWYRIGADYKAIMDETEALVRAVAQALGVETVDGCALLRRPYRRLRVAQAFQDYARIDLGRMLENAAAFADAARKSGIRTVDSDGWDDIFHAVMAEKIEPHLGADVPVFLYDYPASMACLSKRAADPRYAERFELYIGGVELANAFTELTDAREQRARFEDEMAAKQTRYGFSYPLDTDFLAALEHGMPECGGIALGLDRLVMLLAGAQNIDDVLWCGKP